MLRNRLIYVGALALVVVLPVLAHEAPPATADAAAPTADATAPAEEAAPAATDGFQRDVVADLERTGARLIALAEAIPADRYGWRPAEGVRSVSEAFVHVANANLVLPVAMGMAPAEGFTPPADMPAAMAWMREREAGTTAKEEVITELRRSLDYATEALAGLDSAVLEETIQPLGFPASRRAYVLVLLTHNHEHLGQAIAYARSVGVTPPWSQGPPADGEADAEAEADSTYE